MSDKSKLVGMPLDRVDGRLKVSGGAKYAAEFSVPNMAYGVIFQTTVPTGSVDSIDSTKAKALHGVIDVITADHQVITQNPGLTDVFAKNVRFSGQHLAVVVAENFEVAEEAAGLVEVKYTSQPPQVDMNAVLDKAAVPANSGRQPVMKRGDVAAVANPAQRVDQIYRTPPEHHNPMEPHASVASWTADGKLVVYDATQGVTGCAQNLARHFKIPNTDVRVIDPFVGGGFGCKGMPWPHTVVAALAAKAVGRPVKLALTRRQMFTSNGHRPETYQHLTLASDASGRLQSIQADMVNETSRAETFLEPTGNDAAMTYSCANVDVSMKLVRLDIGSPTFMRAPGEASGSFSIESAMDELAYELKMDPVQLRVLNYADTDETKNLPYSSKSLKECYRAGADRFGWSRRNPQPGSMRDGRFHVGYGMATATYPANYRPAHARAEIDGTGRVLIQCGTQDLGTGSYTILTQLAADNLGVDPWLVRVEIADTSLPEAPGSGGSTSAASAGSAVAAAAQSLRGKILALASTQPQSPHNGVPQEQLDTGRGQVFAKSDPSKSVAYAELVARAGGMLDATEAGAGRDNKHAFQSFGAQFCEVQVDPDFGTVRVTRWVGAFAIGRALNMKTLESQLRGGIVFGIGMGLMEETFMDDTFGRYVNTNLAEYHVPVNRDIPAVEVIVVPEEDPYVNPIGVKGAGEIGITGAAAAIANAVNNATGKRVRDLPITLDKVMA